MAASVWATPVFVAPGEDPWTDWAGDGGESSSRGTTSDLLR